MIKVYGCSGCIFPWIYSENSKSYNGCTKFGIQDGDTRYWCATKLENGVYISGSGQWMYCDETCPITTDTYCTSSKQCDVGEGHCDSDNACKGDLVCGKDNCSGNTFDSTDDCCTEPGEI